LKLSQKITVGDHYASENVPNSFYARTIMNKSGFSSLSNNASTYCSLSATGLSISLAGQTATALNHSSLRI
jgi:hypothetical protein